MTWRRALRGPEAAILRHPDQRTPWAPSIVVHLAEPLPAGVASARLAALALAHPILAARLEGAGWVSDGSSQPVVEVKDDELGVLRTRFDLAAGPPVRIVRVADGLRLAIVGHHAALDGRALTLIARCVLGGDIDAVAEMRGSSGPKTQPPVDGEVRRPIGPRGPLDLLMRPDHRVAASDVSPVAESFASAPIPEGARVRVATLASAATGAVGSWNAERGVAWGRIGLTIPVGGPPVIGNVSTHRRLDLDLPVDVAAMVTSALAVAEVPLGAAITPARGRLLRVAAPLVSRLSDSLLVSNLGLVDLAGAVAVDFYPQARGRSAVALGACTPVGGEPRLTLRARDLTPADAEQLLAAVVARIRAAAG